MKIELKYIIKSILFCFLFSVSTFSFAQDTIPKSNVEIEIDLILPDSLEAFDSATIVPTTVQQQQATADTLIHYSLISGVEIGVDYLKFGSLALSSETKYEGYFGILIKNRITLVLEGGTAELQPPSAFKNGDYESKGVYGRAGFNFLLPFNDKNFLITGLRYGMSQFSESVSFVVEDEFGFRQEADYAVSDRSANWYEVLIGSETNVRRNIIIGGILRLRILGNVDKGEPFEPFSIPGYGRVFDRTIPAFNLFIKYRINFRN